MADESNPPEIAIVDRTIIKPIELDDAQGRWIFAPQADITGLEAILISHMWAAVTVRYLKGDQSRFDWREYLTRDYGVASTLRPGEFVRVQPGGPEMVTARKIGLARHFKPVE